MNRNVFYLLGVLWMKSVRVVVVTYCHSSSAHRALELLPKAPPPEPRKLTEREVKQLNQQEEATMRELRLFLRDILNKLGRDRKFQIFAKPVDEEEVMKKIGYSK